MIADDLAPLARPIGELRVLEGNPRRGDVQAVKRSLTRFGQRKPIVAREDGTVIAGNHTLRAALELGWTQIAVVGTDDDEATAKAFALADNRTSSLGTFDLGDLAQMAADVHAIDPELLEAASFTEDELNDLLNGQRKPDERNDPDDAPEPPAQPVTLPGDIWQLGPHRLLCGDSTDVAAVDGLLAGERCDMMWTDPPYGVDYVGKTRQALTIRNDGAADLPALLAGAYAVATAALKPGAAVYIAHPAGALSDVFRVAFNEAGWTFRQGLVWVKDTMVLGHSDYHFQHEPMMFGYTTGAKGRRGRGGEGWYGDDSQVSVFMIPKPSRSEHHPTMKPVELPARCLANSCPPRGSVYDPFGGSGSTLIAAHQASRVARLVELDPGYCDVICRRYQEHTGTKPVLEATAEPHDFAA